MALPADDKAALEASLSEVVDEVLATIDSAFCAALRLNPNLTARELHGLFRRIARRVSRS